MELRHVAFNEGRDGEGRREKGHRVFLQKTEQSSNDGDGEGADGVRSGDLFSVKIGRIAGEERVSTYSSKGRRIGVNQVTDNGQTACGVGDRIHDAAGHRTDNG
jgi:hypothetical protein